MNLLLLTFTCRAAFQYGVKMSDGRKTRRQGAKNDKAKLNREWQQISQVCFLLAQPNIFLFHARTGVIFYPLS